jgi:hypothetical protein
MANPNIVNVTTIYGNTAALAVSTVTANVVQNPSGSSSIYKLNALTISNINAAATTVSLTIELNQAGTNTAIAKNIAVPGNSSIVIIGKDSMIYLLENNSIQLTAGSNSSLSAIASYEQIS